MIALERQNTELMSIGQGSASAIGIANEIRQWANQCGLLSDQAAVAEATLSSNDWITSIEGRAGAAKTTTVGAIREFAEQRGYSVRGFAPTTRAVKSLSDAGVSARTVAGLLESQSQRHDTKQIWIVDESSLLPLPSSPMRREPASRVNDSPQANLNLSHAESDAKFGGVRSTGTTRRRLTAVASLGTPCSAPLAHLGSSRAPSIQVKGARLPKSSHTSYRGRRPALRGSGRRIISYVQSFWRFHNSMIVAFDDIRCGLK